MAGAGEIMDGSGIQILFALAESQNPVPNTHSGVLTATCKSRSRGSLPTSGLLASMWDTPIQTQTYNYSKQTQKKMKPGPTHMWHTPK